MEDWNIYDRAVDEVFQEKDLKGLGIKGVEMFSVKIESGKFYKM